MVFVSKLLGSEVGTPPQQPAELRQLPKHEDRVMNGHLATEKRSAVHLLLVIQSGTRVGHGSKEVVKFSVQLREEGKRKRSERVSAWDNQILTMLSVSYL